MSTTSHHHIHTAATNEGNGEGSKLALLAALGLLVGYGSYRYSKSLMSKQRRPNQIEEEKKATDSRDQKKVDKMKRIEL
jgi:hypothetical protein